MVNKGNNKARADMVSKGDTVESTWEATAGLRGEVKQVDGKSVMVSWEDWSCGWVKVANVKKVS